MKQQSDRQIAWGLALALFGLIMLTWNGIFHSSDGLMTYAVADSLARYGRFDTEQIRWMGPAHKWMFSFGPDGLFYSHKGLGTSILVLPLTWAGLILPGLGPVHTSLLLMPLVTAATGALLYLASRRAFPTVPRTAAVLGTLAWGLGSLAWPYSKTFFSEPLIALATIGAMERLLAFREAEARSQRELVAAFGLGCWLGLGILTRVVHIIVLPAFGLAILVLIWRRYGRAVTRWPLRLLLALAVPLGIAVGLTLWYNWLRFGDPLTTGDPLSIGFTGVWWRGVAGLLVSPGRGLLWYVPWVVLVVLAIPRAWRLAPVVTATAGATFLAYLLVYGKWLAWPGGYCWGPRFLVPTLPLLGLLAVAAAARWRRAFTLLALLAVAVNLIGVAWDAAVHQDTLLIKRGLSSLGQRFFFDARYAQIPGVLRMMGRFETLDVMWVREGQLHLPLAITALALAAIGVVGGWMIALGRDIRLPGVVGRQVSSHWQIVLLLAVTLYPFLWQARAVQPSGYHRLAEAVTAHSPPGTMIWHNDHPGISTFLNLYKGRATVLGVYEPNDTLSPETVDRLSSLAALPQPVWVVSRDPMETMGVLDRAASQHRGVIQEVSLFASVPRLSRSPDEPEVLKALFYFDTPDWRAQPLDVKMGPDAQPLIRLAEAGLSPAAKPGGVIATQLVWEALSPVSEQYQVFVQLFGPDGTPVALHVGPAQNGLAPTSAWQPGRPVTDVHAFALRADAASGDYQFLVALHRLTDMTRLRTTDGRDAVMVGPISVAP